MRYLLLFFTLFFFISCSESPHRTYKIKDENGLKLTQAPPASGAEVPVDDHDHGTGKIIPLNKPLSVPLKWKAPAKWTEKAGAGMRMGTLTTPDGHDVSLIAFPGKVGGLEANLSRWAGQIGLSADSAAHIRRDNFEGQYPYLFVDFSALVADGAETIMAGIFTFTDQTLFVKLKGQKVSAQARKQEFRSFLNSIQ